MSMHPVEGKSELRKLLRQRRRALGPAQQAQAAADLAEQLAALPAFGQSESVALYLANDGEIDPAEAMRWRLDRGKRCYVPIIGGIGGEGNVLRFGEVTPHTRFRRNRFGIAEPALSADELIDAGDLDLVLLPLVGFDRRGNRIGMGGGFYDTTFAFKQRRPHALPRLVGLAHEIQRLDEIDAENWDIPIAEVVTDERVYQCESA